MPLPSKSLPSSWEIDIIANVPRGRANVMGMFIIFTDGVQNMPKGFREGFMNKEVFDANR